MQPSLRRGDDKIRSPEDEGTNVDRQPVESEMLASVGYEADSLTLELEYTNGRVYQYFDVPPQLHDELVRSPSVGAFVNAQIRGVYRYARI
jgi:hypothetical protein